MSRYRRHRRKHQGESTICNPNPHCRSCLGTGWVQDEQLSPITRETTEGPVRYAPPMRRCSCVYRNSGSGDGPPKPEDMPGAIDQMQRASGERRE